MRIPLVLALLTLATVVAAGAAQAAEQAHCDFDAKSLTWRIGNREVERTIHFDGAAGALRTLAVAARVSAVHVVSLPGAEGGFEAEAAPGGSPAQVTLDRDWAYMWQSVAHTGDGGRLLTIHLQGVRSHKGWEVEALYSAPAEGAPGLGKALTIVNRTGQDGTVLRVRLDRWTLAPARRSPDFRIDRTSVDGQPALLDPASGARVAATVSGSGAEVTVGPIGGTPLALDVQVRAGAATQGTGGRYRTPWSYLTVIPAARRPGRPARHTR